MQVTMDWEHNWGIGHEYPQLVMTGVVHLDMAEQREIVNFYRHLKEYVLEQ